MFQPRKCKPTAGNRYYIRTINGGYNQARTGKPLDKECNVLANCVGYANGRFAEIIGKPFIEYQFTKNAENFIEDAIKFGLEISDKPTLRRYHGMERRRQFIWCRRCRPCRCSRRDNRRKYYTNI